jgi:hypothetical protein
VFGRPFSYLASKAPTFLPPPTASAGLGATNPPESPPETTAADVAATLLRKARRESPLADMSIEKAFATGTNIATMKAVLNMIGFLALKLKSNQKDWLPFLF